MDDKGKNASFQVDQEILDARGINMTVLEVAGLSTCKYSERVQGMRLSQDDLAFLKGLRRRIKNRLASQNSRRRSMEHLRRLSRELRAVRACKGDAAAERALLLEKRREIADRARKLRAHVVQILKERSDPTPVPDVEPPHQSINQSRNESQSIPEKPREKSVHYLFIEDPKVDLDIVKSEIDEDSTDVPKKINAKTVFLNSHFSDLKDDVKDGCNGVKDEFDVKDEFNDLKEGFTDIGGVLNLSIKREGRRSHGRKQSAPRRIAYAFCDYEDTVLDLKIKKETH